MLALDSFSMKFSTVYFLCIACVYGNRGGQPTAPIYDDADAKSVSSTDTVQKTVLPHEDMKRPAEVQHEVEMLIHRLEKLNDTEVTAEFAEELGDVENALAKQGAGSKKLVKEISSVRKELCIKQGFAGHEAAECDAYIRASCSNATATSSVPQELCQQSLMHHDAVAAPAAAPDASPAAAPAPPGLFGSKKLRPLASQGFQGKPVEHKDSHTLTDDWQLEFGPKSGHRDARDICRDFKNNEWCRLHGYYEQHHSAALSKKLGLASMGAALLLFCAGL